VIKEKREGRDEGMGTTIVKYKIVMRTNYGSTVMISKCKIIINVQLNE